MHNVCYTLMRFYKNDPKSIYKVIFKISLEAIFKKNSISSETFQFQILHFPYHFQLFQMYYVFVHFSNPDIFCWYSQKFKNVIFHVDPLFFTLEAVYAILFQMFSPIKKNNLHPVTKNKYIDISHLHIIQLF